MPHILSLAIGLGGHATSAGPVNIIHWGFCCGCCLFVFFLGGVVVVLLTGSSKEISFSYGASREDQGRIVYPQRSRWWGLFPSVARVWGTLKMLWWTGFLFLMRLLCSHALCAYLEGKCETVPQRGRNLGLNFKTIPGFLWTPPLFFSLSVSYCTFFFFFK